jgi:hypothetical protein
MSEAEFGAQFHHILTKASSQAYDLLIEKAKQFDAPFAHQVREAKGALSDLSKR